MLPSAVLSTQAMSVLLVLLSVIRDTRTQSGEAPQGEVRWRTRDALVVLCGVQGKRVVEAEVGDAESAKGA